MKYTYLLILNIFFFSCGNKPSTSGKIINDTIKIEIDTINVESLVLDSVANSYEIETNIVNEHIFVLDKLFCNLYHCGANGELENIKLGQGHSKSETSMGRIAGCAFDNAGSFVLVDYQGAYSMYNNEIFLKKNIIADYGKKDKSLLKSVECYDNPIVYTKFYNNLVCRLYDSVLYFNVDFLTPVYNILDTPNEHLPNVYSIMSIDFGNDGKSKLYKKGLPNCYRDETQAKALFTRSIFDISSKGEFMVSYEADSLIYMFNKDFLDAKVFGRSGRDMNTDYRICHNLKDFGKYYIEEHEVKGHYTGLEYVDDTGLLLRSYRKGSHSSSDGLQIYRNGTLIADLSVPKGFCPIGYIAPYYYSNVIADEEKGKLMVYRFKL